MNGINAVSTNAVKVICKWKIVDNQIVLCNTVNCISVEKLIFGVSLKVIHVTVIKFSLQVIYTAVV